MVSIEREPFTFAIRSRDTSIAISPLLVLLFRDSRPDVLHLNDPALGRANDAGLTAALRWLLLRYFYTPQYSDFTMSGFIAEDRDREPHVTSETVSLDEV